MLNTYFQDKERRLILHCCCAPCACSIIEKLIIDKIIFEIFFYNPNIHPDSEYFRRKYEIIRYAKKMGVPVIDTTYDPQTWMNHIKGHELDVEKGARCSLCFEYRLFKTAEYAYAHGYSAISSTLGMSRRKNFEQVSEAGRKAVVLFKNLIYIDYNWRKGSGTLRSHEIIKREQLYRQSYCGCIFSAKNRRSDHFLNQCKESSENKLYN